MWSMKRSTGITWELVRNAEAQAPPRPTESESALVIRSPGERNARKSLRSTTSRSSMSWEAQDVLFIKRRRRSLVILLVLNTLSHAWTVTPRGGRNSGPNWKALVSSSLVSHWTDLCWVQGCPDGSDGKESACDEGDLGLIPRSGKSPGEGNGNPLQYSCLTNSVERGGWQAIRQVRHMLPNNDLDEPSGPFDKKIGKHFKSPQSPHNYKIDACDHGRCVFMVL